MHLKVSFDQREVTSTLELQQVKLQQIASLELVKKNQIGLSSVIQSGIIVFSVEI